VGPHRGDDGIDVPAEEGILLDSSDPAPDLRDWSK
jgi:hypothetical protein